MPHRRHRAAPSQGDATMPGRPIGQARPRNSGRQPSRRANGANASSKMRRGPLSAPIWLTRMSSPPGHTNEIIQRRLGIGTAVITYCATTEIKHDGYRLIASGRLTEEASRRRSFVEAALAEVLCDWVARWQK
jgi:hypothetical protein